MKKYILIIMLAISTISNAQTLNGIGKLRLNMSLKEVRAMFPKTMIRQNVSSKVKKVYKVNAYTPIKGTTLKGLHLYFYNDTLYSIYVDEAPMSLKKDLTLKIGKPNKIFPNPVYDLRCFYSYLEYQVYLYKNDAVDFYDEIERKIDSYDFIGDIVEWESNNPFLEVRYSEMSYECKGNIFMDNIFYIKNLAYAKCVELEEKILEREEEHERLQELDGL